jgi:leader peptidase (prepilin peptidase)/N-methyltransferase
MLPVAYVAATAIPLMVIDFKQHRLPNKIVLPIIGLTFLSQLTLAIWTGAWASLGISLGLGFAALAVGLYLNYKDWIGMGDVKLLAGLTMMLSWFTVLGGALLMPISIVLGLIVAAIAVLTTNIKQLPLGPTLLATFAATLTITLI